MVRILGRPAESMVARAQYFWRPMISRAASMSESGWICLGFAACAKPSEAVTLRRTKANDVSLKNSLGDIVTNLPMIDNQGTPFFLIPIPLCLRDFVAILFA
ncbi:MAG: hypothetical protein A2X66_09840 [Ignavibacteria bacterium GWA2_54_16]|nr:MAG: hypothetical protein A2X66_09840 [Ignavibacteria bacterium GWA2_54_16]